MQIQVAPEALTYKILPVAEMPTAIVPMPTDLVEIYTVCLQLELLCRYENGVGISAIQAGIPWNLFLVKFDNSFRYFFDCTYTRSGIHMVRNTEGCLSLRENGKPIFYKVERWKAVWIIGKELVVPSGSQFAHELFVKEVHKKYEMPFAAVWQHEIDHGNLRLISEHGVKL